MATFPPSFWNGDEDDHHHTHLPTFPLDMGWGMTRAEAMTIFPLVCWIWDGDDKGRSFWKWDEDDHTPTFLTEEGWG